MDWTRRFALAGAAVWALLAQAMALAQQPEQAVPAARLDITAPVLETTIAGLRLHGPGPLDVLEIADLGILMTDSGNRYVPLLRLLETLQISLQVQGDTLQFQAPGRPLTQVDFVRRHVSTRPGRQDTADVQTGISDATFRPEIYVPDSLAARLFGMPFTWDAARYEYTIRTDTRLPVFAINYLPRRSLRAMAADVPEPVERLPENLPPANPGANSDLLTFFQLRLYGSALGVRSFSTRQSGDLLNMSYSAHPQLGIWGRMLGGNYSLEINQNYTIVAATPRSWTRVHGGWTRRLSNVGVTLGDINLRLGDLIFPHLSLRGIAFGGVSGRPNPAVQSRLDPRQFFAPIQVFEGYAPLGSKVELYINGQLFDTHEVRQDAQAQSGEGKYRFEGVNLLTGRLNEVQFVIERPDGLREEVRREVMGSRNLLQSGQWAVLGGVGKQRLFSFNGDHFQGLFAGAQAMYGLGSRLTVGFSGALQNAINASRSFFAFGSLEPLATPTQSLHAGTSLAVRFNDHMVSHLNLAGSRSGKTGPPHIFLGGQFATEIQFGRVQIEPKFFRFEPHFFNGVNPQYENRQGFSLQNSLSLAKSGRIRLTVGEIQDNVWKQAENTLRVRFIRASFSTPRLLPKTNLDVLGDRRSTTGQGIQTIFRFETRSRLPWNLSLTTRYRFGEDRTRFDINQMLLIPGLGYQPFFDSQKLLFSLYWDPFAPSSAAITHWQSEDFNRSLLTYSYHTSGSRRWQIRFELGRDWQRNEFFGNARFEYALDSWSENRLGLATRYDGYWTVEFIFQLQNLFSLSPLGVNRLKNVRLTPGQKGIWGKTFLDINANGRPDAGEPGLAGIPVLAKGRWGLQATSQKNGLFVLPVATDADSLRISLESQSLPAIYTVTQGTQVARLRSGAFTRVYLGLASLGSISGKVYLQQAGGTRKALAGIKLRLVNADSAARAGISITDRSGGYYFGEVKPGRYAIALDPKSFAEQYILVPDSALTRLSPANQPDLTALLAPKSNPPGPLFVRFVELEPARKLQDIEGMDFTLQRPKPAKQE